MIDEKHAEKALHYLAETDEAYAEAKTKAKGLEYRLKTAKAAAFLEADGTVAEREALALNDLGYREMLDEFEDAMLDMEIYQAKRKRAELTIEFWRSLNANRRQG